VYLQLTAAWPFQVRRRDFGALLTRLESVQQEITQAGPAGQKAQDVALGEVKASISELRWDSMSRKWRAVAWCRLCSTFVKRLEPLLAKRARISRSEELTAGRRERMCRARQERKARKRAHKTVAPWRQNQRARQIRKVAPLVTRRVRVVAGPRLRRVPVDGPTPAERTLRHIRVQRRRSQRRARLLEIRMQWARKRDDEIAASEDLWQFAHEDESSRRPDRDLSAWPRLAQRQREQLAEEVDAFGRVPREEVHAFGTVPR